MPVLGFGCSVLGGDLSRRRQQALVEAAFDAGLRHFDVAPAYGHGEAERVLGDVLHGVRDQVILATKVGIAHPQHAGGLAAVRRALRPLKSLLPGLWGRAANQVRRSTAARGRFQPDQVSATFQESLRRLRTDRIDHLLLHEAVPEDVVPALLAQLNALREQGAVHELGLGTTVEHSVVLLQAHGAAFDRVQTDHYWGAFSPALRAGGHRLATHRCLRSGLALIRAPQMQRLVSEAEEGASLAQALDDPIRGPELLLQAGLRMLGGGGTLLVSSSDPQRVRDMAALTSGTWDPAPADALNACMQRLAEANVSFRPAPLSGQVRRR